MIRSLSLSFSLSECSELTEKMSEGDEVLLGNESHISHYEQDYIIDITLDDEGKERLCSYTCILCRSSHIVSFMFLA